MAIKLKAVAQCEWCGKEHEFLISHNSSGYYEKPPGWEHANLLIATPELLCPNCHDRYANGRTRP